MASSSATPILVKNLHITGRVCAGILFFPIVSTVPHRSTVSRPLALLTAYCVAMLCGHDLPHSPLMQGFGVHGLFRCDTSAKQHFGALLQGMDELTPMGSADVVEATPDSVRRYTLEPKDLGIQR